MLKKKLNTFLATVLFLLLGLLVYSYKSPPLALSATNHIVLSEIQLRTSASAEDEFVELYNPTGVDINVSGWRLTRKTSGGSQSNLVASMSGTIAAHGFFLITSQTSSASGSADLLYSTGSSIATDNTVLVYSDSGVTLVDKVGLGVATDFESTTAANPASNESVERKANSSSTIDSMTTAVDVLMGNGEDTDNNGADFIVRAVAEPQNSASTHEPVAGPSPTPVPSSSPSISPEPTVSPSVTPSISPSPTVQPSPTPSVSPTPQPSVSPSPSLTPSATPTVSPTATPVSSPQSSVSPTPSTSPTPFPTPPVGPFVIFSGRLFTCTVEYRTIFRRFFSFSIPHFECNRNN